MFFKIQFSCFCYNKNADSKKQSIEFILYVEEN